MTLKNILAGTALGLGLLTSTATAQYPSQNIYMGLTIIDSKTHMPIEDAIVKAKYYGNWQEPEITDEDGNVVMHIGDFENDLRYSKDKLFEVKHSDYEFLKFGFNTRDLNLGIAREGDSIGPFYVDDAWSTWFVPVEGVPESSNFIYFEGTVEMNPLHKHYRND